ncbi:hypothetical protein B296_00053464, partial [Ensete ventricosum]
GEIDSAFVYEDRTRRFFPPAPRVPRMPGLNAGDGGFMDDLEDTFHELSTSPRQHFNMLSSGDKDDLSQLVVLSFGELTENLVKPKGKNVLKDEEYAEVQKSEAEVRESWTIVGTIGVSAREDEIGGMGMKTPRGRKRDHETIVSRSSNWLTNIHLRQELKLLSSSDKGVSNFLEFTLPTKFTAHEHIPWMKLQLFQDAFLHDQGMHKGVSLQM